MQDFATGKAAFSKALRQLTCFFEKNQKALRIMKITGILLMATCLQVSAKGLTQTVTISVKDAPLLSVLIEIKKQTGYTFFADSKQLQKAKKVSISAKNLPLVQVLDLCFKNQPLTYTIVDNVINVVPRNDKASNDNFLPQSPPLDVRGKIVNENGEPVLATVSIKGTAKGTTTNDNGEFQLLDVPENAILVISGVGLETKELRVNGQSSMYVTVKISVAPLEETIIKGYYATTRKFNTGNVTKIKGEEIQKQPVTDPILALQGRVAGLYIRQSSGIPGANFSSSGNFSIRGRNSMTSRNLPLYIVDGVPYTSATLSNQTIGTGALIGGISPFNTISPAEIESIEVLKDADATAIYGSRGANGVILITTKKGKVGKSRVDVNVASGIGKVSHYLNLLNTEEYIQMRKEAFNNDQIPVPSYTSDPNNRDWDINGAWDQNRYTDWQKVFIGGTAHFTQGNLSVSGGNELTQFVVGGSYTKQTTVFPGNYSDKVGSGHFNLNHSSPNRKFIMSFSASYSNDNIVLPPSDFTSQITIAPNAPELYDANGNINWRQNSNGAYTFNNPIAATNRKAVSIADNLIANMGLNYEIFNGLVLRCSLGYNKVEMNQNNLTPLSAFSPAAANLPQVRSNNFANNTLRTWIIEPQLNYKKALWKGNLEALIGATFQENKQKSFSEFANTFISDDLISNIAAASSVSIGDYNFTQYRYNALYARVGYNLLEKYLVNLTGRRDGSSRFGEGFQFGNFGALGIGWIFSNEKFFGKIPFLSFGKIRASIGTSGIDQIPDYQYLSSYSVYNFSYQGSTGLFPTRIPNPYYHWEEVRKREVGLELSFFKDKLSVAISYYNNRTNNQLVGYSLPTITGFSSITANLPAKIENKGLEFEVSSINLKTRNFTWQTSANISFPKNKLLKYPNFEKSSYANTYTIGQPLYSTKGFHYLTVDPQTGLYTFTDVNKDASISYPEDLLAMKPITQKFFGGFQNVINYKSFQLDIFLQFVKQRGTNFFGYFPAPGTMSNQPVDVLSRWQKPGDITNVQKFSQNNSLANGAYFNAKNSDYFIDDASFIRVKNVSLAYNVPKEIINKIHLQGIKIYMQGQNLFTITKYKGMDPETFAGLTLPPLRMIVGGVQLSL